VRSNKNNSIDQSAADGPVFIKKTEASRMLSEYLSNAQFGSYVGHGYVEELRTKAVFLCLFGRLVYHNFVASVPRAQA
jgi:hypothetical protein